MKKFKLVGPETTKEFETEDDEMVVFYAIKEADYLNKAPIQNTMFHKMK